MPTITIAGKPFTVEPRYAAGHALTEGEASALNQTLFENLRNNLAGKAKKGEDITQETVTSYLGAYEFGVRAAGAPRLPADPVETEALRIAVEQIKSALAKKGQTVKVAQVKEMAAKLLAAAEGDKHFETAQSFRKLAKKRVDEARRLTADLDGLEVPEAPAGDEPVPAEAAAA